MENPKTQFPEVPLSQTLSTPLDRMFEEWINRFVFGGRFRRKPIERFAIPEDNLGLIETFNATPVLKDAILRFWKEAYTGYGTGIIMACLDELAQLQDALKDRKFDTFVEVGSWGGGSLWVYSKLFVRPGGTVICVEPVKRPELAKVIDMLRNDGYQVRHFCTLGETCIEDVKRAISPRAMEFLHLDAEHDIDSCRRMWNCYAPLVSADGVVVIHDTVLWSGPYFLRRYLEKKSNIKTFSGTLLLSQIPKDTTGTSVVFSDGNLPRLPWTAGLWLMYFLEKVLHRFKNVLKQILNGWRGKKA